MPTRELERTRRKILAFLQTYGSAHLDLACHAAFPFALTSELLYCLRENFLPESPWIAVADVLLSPWFDSVGDDLYEMEPQVQGFLLRQLAEDYRFGERRLKELADFTTAYVNAKLPENPRAERDFGRGFHWLALACIRPGEARRQIRDLLRRAIATGRDDERQRWIELLAGQQDVLGELGFEPALLLEELDSLPSFPPLETFEFEEGYFERVEESGETVDLQPFEFQTARLEIVNSEVAIHRSSGRAFQFVESLPKDVKLEMVAIRGGTFLMGAAEGEEGADSYEYPQHKVTVPNFFMGKYQVTQLQWQAVTAELSLGDNRPVERVSWDDARQFCVWLEQITGHAYRLPSEAEWEYACRAETTTPFAFGETITPELANYNGNYPYGKGLKGQYRKETTEVGSFPANAFGLYDMHGNVWEWCYDQWHDSYKGAPTNGSAWVDNNNDFLRRRLLRGGSWGSAPRVCRSALRSGIVPNHRYYHHVGFRVCCSVARTP